MWYRDLLRPWLLAAIEEWKEEWNEGKTVSDKGTQARYNELTISVDMCGSYDDQAYLRMGGEMEHRSSEPVMESRICSSMRAEAVRARLFMILEDYDINC